MIAPARLAAYQALRLIDTGRLDLPSALAQTRRGLTDERDRALAVELATGSLRWQRTLDHLVEQVSNRALGKVDRDVLVILRLSLYQLLHLTRVPAAAVVDDAVDLVRAAHKSSATGFVNAVLRTTLRLRRALPIPPRPVDPGDRDAAVRYLGIAHSHPDWLVRRLLDRHGFDAAERWVRFDNETPRTTVRANALRGTRDALRQAFADAGIDAVPTSFAPRGLTIVSGSLLRMPADGSFVVQDEASQLVPLVVDARPGESVLDLCASPGGKTTALADEMQDAGLLVASDVRARRVRLLSETVRLSGARRVQVVQVPVSGALPFSARFDRVLVDAPCSGLGTVRRDPDIRWRRTDADLPECAARQERLLSRAAEVVRAGGRLVYATCSSEPEENEAVVDAFLARHAGWSLVDLREEMAAHLHGLLDARGFLRTLPHAHGLEAFFAAALVRVSQGA
jgi:16S rRNA (cytosine967-C5)-methyltransferase